METDERTSRPGAGLCGKLSRGDGHELSQDVLGRLEVVVGDHQRFLDVLDRVALRHQAFDLSVQGRACGACGRRRKGRG